MEDQIVKIEYDKDKRNASSNSVTNGEYFLRMHYLL
jgi:hypothetical protein